jgi:vacuolar-type H+-ATPase subunit C/Vma6
MLTQSDYSKMKKMTANEIAEYLEERGFKKHIDAYAHEYSEEKLVEKAVNANLEENLQRMFKLSYGDMKPQLALYLQRFDVQNIKTIARGIVNKEPPEHTTKSIINVGSVSPETWQQAVKNAKTIPELVKYVGLGPYRKILEQHSSSLHELENALDAAYYKMLLMSTHGRFKAWCETEADLCNALLILKERNAGREHAKALEIRTRKHRLKQQALNTENPSKAVHKITISFAKLAKRELSIFSYSAAPFAAFMRLKEFEASNIKLLAFASATEMGEEELEEQLVIA